MAGDPIELKVSPNTITQITAIKRNETAITPIIYNGTFGSSYSTFFINDFLSGDIVTFSAQGYSNLDVTMGTSDVVNFIESYQTIAFYKHAGVTYEIEDEKARQNIATKQSIPKEITDLVSSSQTFNSSNKLKANADYTFGELTSLTFDNLSVDSSPLGTTIKFTSGATATVITDNSGIDWVDGSAPAPSANKTCLILIFNKMGFYKEW